MFQLIKIKPHQFCHGFSLGKRLWNYFLSYNIEFFTKALHS